MGQQLIRGRYILADPAQAPTDGGVIEDGAVLVEGDRILAVGAYDSLKAGAQDAEEWGSAQHLVIPGLVNAHVHGRGLSPLHLGITDEQLETYLIDYMALKPLDVFLDTLYANLQLIRSGVTTVVHSGLVRDPNNAETELRDAIRAYDEAGLRVAFAVPLQDQSNLVYLEEEKFFASLPGDLGARAASLLAGGALTDPEEGFGLMDRLLDDSRDRDRLSILAGPVGPEWSSDALLRRAREYADANGISLHMHCLESPIQRDVSFKCFGKSSVRRLLDLGFLGPDCSLAHCTWFNDADIDLCAETGTAVSHNASCNLRLHAGVAPVARMLERGVPVAIGTDGFTINSDEDFLQEIRLVSSLHRMPRGTGAGFPSTQDLLAMATVNGARVAGLSETCGRLLPGMAADLVVLDLDAICAPYVDPAVGIADRIISLAKREHVVTVMAAGEVLFHEGSFTKVDAAGVTRTLAETAARSPGPDFEAFKALMSELKPFVADYYEGWDWRTGVAPAYIANAAG